MPVFANNAEERHLNAETPPNRPVEESAGSDKVDALLKVVLSSLEDDKAEEVVEIDLKGKSSIADYMVVASGRSARQVSAIAEHLTERVKHAGFAPCRTEGKGQADWVVIDAGDVIVHIFRPEVRDFYKLEKMWSAEMPPEAVAV